VGDLAGLRCDFCGRVDESTEDPGEVQSWLLVELTRVSPDDDELNDTIDLVFCAQSHAASYLAQRDVPWPEPGPGADTTSGLWAGRLFLLIGLVAILLSAVGVVAILRWVF
jgi:hypothetical protein